MQYYNRACKILPIYPPVDSNVLLFMHYKSSKARNVELKENSADKYLQSHFLRRGLCGWARQRERSVDALMNRVYDDLQSAAAELSADWLMGRPREKPSEPRFILFQW